MKIYLLVTGAIFALFAAMHFYIAWDHWRRPAADLWSGLGPLLVGIGSGALAVWTFRLGRSRSSPAS